MSNRHLILKINRLIKSAYEKGKIKKRKKCCQKCAFRRGSIERSEPYGWMRLVDTWFQDKQPFVCHEGIKGHPQQVEGEGIRLCAGWSAFNDSGKMIDAYNLAHTDQPDPDAKFLQGYEEDQ